MSTPVIFDRVVVDAIPDEVYRLVYEELYRGWDVKREENWYEPKQGGEFLIARNASAVLLGALRLMPRDEAHPERLQIRQVVVNPELRGGGVGRALMARAEDAGREKGCQVAWLKARKPAWGFYERLGYQYVSEVYLSALTQIPHRTMEKAL